MNILAWFVALLILYLLILKQSQEKPSSHGFPVEKLPADLAADLAQSAGTLFEELLRLEFDPPVFFRAGEVPELPWALLSQRNLACYALVTAGEEGGAGLRLLAFLADGTLLLSGEELPWPSLRECPWIHSLDRTGDDVKTWVAEFSRRLRREADAGRGPGHALVDSFDRQLGRVVDAWDQVKINRLHADSAEPFPGPRN